MSEQGVYVNVVDLVDICTKALTRAATLGDRQLEMAARSVMSALVLHLGKRHASLPEEIRPLYNYILRN